jgi:hypothetical protein
MHKHRSSSVFSPIAKIDALLAGITKADIARMPPANRLRLAQALRHIADIADPPPNGTAEIPKAGILGDLGNGARAE